MAGIKVAGLYGQLTLDDKPYRRGMDKVHKDTVGFVGQITGTYGRLRGVIGTALGVGAALGITVGIQKAISAASDLNESVSKTQATFHESAGIITGAADEMAKKYGVVKKEFIDGAVNLGLMGKATGMSADEAANLGVKFAKLAADIASFDNIPVEEALMVLRSGLAGESEPLRRFGVLIDEATVKQEAMRMGLSATGKNLDMQTKTMVRASLIYKGFADRQGDLERTAGSAANMARNLGGQIENLYAEIGTAMLPAVQEVMPKVGEAIQTLGAVIREHTEDIKKLADAIGVGLVGALEKVPGLVHTNIENYNAMIDTWNRTPKWITDALSGTFGALASPFSPSAPTTPTPPGLDAAVEAATKRARAIDAARARDLKLGGVFGGIPEAPGIPNPFLDKIREREMGRQSAQAIASRLGAVPGLAGLPNFGMPATGLMRPEGMMTDEERLKGLEQQRSLIAGLIPEVVQRTSQLFTEGGSMEQQFQQRILEQTDKQDEANKLLDEINKGIAELKEVTLKKAVASRWAMIAPAGAAK